MGRELRKKGRVGGWSPYSTRPRAAAAALAWFLSQGEQKKLYALEEQMQVAGRCGRRVLIQALVNTCTYSISTSSSVMQVYDD